MSDRTGLDLIVHCADDPTLTRYNTDDRYFSDEDVRLARAELAALRAKAALADDLYRIWRGHESQCKVTMYLENWMERYEAIK